MKTGDVSATQNSVFRSQYLILFLFHKLYIAKYIPCVFFPMFFNVLICMSINKPFPGFRELYKDKPYQKYMKSSDGESVSNNFWKILFLKKVKSLSSLQHLEKYFAGPIGFGDQFERPGRVPRGLRCRRVSKYTMSISPHFQHHEKLINKTVPS